MGAKVIAAETQTDDEYDEYVCDMACYNRTACSRPRASTDPPMQIFNQYMRDYRGHVHQKLVRDYAMRGGEMFDCMLTTSRGVH